MTDLGASLTPLAGGHSGRTFAGEVAGDRAVIRIYPPGDPRGPQAPEVDAAVLRLVRGLLPVADVLDVRREDPASSQPGLLVTSWMTGERGDELVAGLQHADLARLGRAMGHAAATLAGMPFLRPGPFVDPALTVGRFPATDLPEWVETRLTVWSATQRARLLVVAEAAQDLLDGMDRTCLVHSDLNPKNVLVDPDTLAVTALVDWEFAHAGSPWSDLGNLLRFDRDPDFAGAVVAAYRGFVPEPPEDLMERARAADLFALVDLAARRGENPVADAAHDRLLAIARTRDPHTAPGWT